MDTDGRPQKLWNYVVSNLAYLIILGKPWLGQNDVFYMARKPYLRFESRQNRFLVRAGNWYEDRAPSSIRSRVALVGQVLATVTTGSVFAVLEEQARKTEDAVIGAVSMHDITQALQSKFKDTDKEVKEKLPKERNR